MDGYKIATVEFEVDEVRFEAYVEAVGDVDCYSDLDYLRDIRISEMYSVGGEAEKLELDENHYVKLYETNSDFHDKVYKAIEEKLSKHNWELAWYE